jgi:hypothetical protein
MEEVKKISLLDIVSLLKKGLNLIQISKKLGVSKQRINYYISNAKKKGLVKKLGYGVWEINPIEEVKISTQATSPQVRGHAFIWKIQPRKQYNWKQLLFEKGISYKEKGIAKIPSIEVQNRKVWLGQKNIIIYEPESFFGQNSIESRKLAVYSLLETLRAIESLLGIQIKGFRFTPNREHYSLIKNELARQCNKNGEKINVFNEKGLWLSIDDSFNLNELETLGSIQNDPLGTNLQVQKWYNDMKETGFKVTPSFLLESISKVNNNVDGLVNGFDNYGLHISSHIKAIEQLGKAVEELTKKVNDLGNR